MSMRSLFIALVVVLPAMADPPADLSDKTYSQWRDRIRPRAEDLSYQTVDWLPTFWDGVMKAQKEDRPILLFAMNGHPLACT